MKGKRYKTEEKIRVLRESDGDKTIGEVCREHNISEVTFPRFPSWEREVISHRLYCLLPQALKSFAWVLL